MDHWEQNDDGLLWRWYGPYLVSVWKHEDLYRWAVSFHNVWAEPSFEGFAEFESDAMSDVERVAETLILSRMEAML